MTNVNRIREINSLFRMLTDEQIGKIIKVLATKTTVFWVTPSESLKNILLTM